MTLKQYYHNFLSTTQRSDTVTLESAFRAGYNAAINASELAADTHYANERVLEAIRSLKESK